MTAVPWKHIDDQKKTNRQTGNKPILEGSQKLAKLKPLRKLLYDSSESLKGKYQTLLKKKNKFTAGKVVDYQICF